MDVDRETMAAALIGTGGAWLLGSAMLQGRADGWNSRQVKGLAFAGVGFLMSAVAAQYLQHLGTRGMVVSLVGTLFAMCGMYMLVRERAARRIHDSAAQKPRTPE